MGESESKKIEKEGDEIKANKKLKRDRTEFTFRTDRVLKSIVHRGIVIGTMYQ